MQRAHRPPQGKVPFLQLPFRQRGQFFARIIREKSVTDIEQINPAIKPAGPGLGPPMRPLGDHAQQAVVASKKR